MAGCKLSADNIGFLIAEIARLMRQQFAIALEGSPLTFAEARALLFVARHEGARQVALAELAEVQPITMARLIDTLVSHGLVERRADPADRRAFQIYLLDGAALELERIRQIGDAIQTQALGSLDASEVKQLLLQVRDQLAASRREA